MATPQPKTTNANATTDKTGQGSAQIPADRGSPSPGDPGGTWLWHACVMGSFFLPPDPNDGSVVVEADSTAKKDKKKGAGKNKSKSTKQGKEDVKIKIKCEFTSLSWGDGDTYGKGWESILAELDPNHPEGGGGPYAFSHPDTNRRGVKSVMVDKIGKVTWQGRKCTVEIDCTEWTEPDKPSGNGTSTPKKTDPSKWHSHSNPGDVPFQADPKKDPLIPAGNGAPSPANK